MKITHYLYNAFLIEDEGIKIAIDPGQYFGLFNLRPLIPEAEWSGITHIVITHADPDHYWHADRVAAASKAHVICGKGLARVVDGETLLVDPRGRELTSWISFDNVHALDVGESASLGGAQVTAIKTEHGPIEVPLLGFKITRHPAPDERVGLGSMGFEIAIGDKKLVNLGDSILRPEWAGLYPDVLMLPIGGKGNNTWTMDVTEAVEALRLISPRIVIPCHYNVPFLWIKNIAPADDQRFKREVEELGVECRILGAGDQAVV